MNTSLHPIKCSRLYSPWCWGGLVLVIAGLWLASAPVLRGIARLLIVNQSTANANFLWIPTNGGDNCDPRLFAAVCRLYQEDPSRRILLTQPKPTRLVRAGVLPPFQDTARRELVHRGISPATITMLAGEAADFWEEASLLSAWLQSYPNNRVLVVCDLFASGNCYGILSRVLPSVELGRVQVAAIPNVEYDDANWWRSRTGVKDFMHAWLARAFVFIRNKGLRQRPNWDPDVYQQSLEQDLHGTDR